MQFVYSEVCGSESLTIDTDIYKYLFKARRHKVEDVIAFRNLKDHSLYFYKVISVSKKEACLHLESCEEKVIEASKKLHLIWCVVDPKTIEKQLPYLNELGVDKISFVYGDYSQKNFKLNFDKFEKIVINSCQQCGRSSFISFEHFENLQSALSLYPDAYMFNFSPNKVDEVGDIQSIVVGCEGGFSQREIELFDEKRVVGIDSPLILRSETAASALAAKLIL